MTVDGDHDVHTVAQNTSPQQPKQKLLLVDGMCPHLVEGTDEEFSFGIAGKNIALCNECFGIVFAAKQELCDSLLVEEAAIRLGSGLLAAIESRIVAQYRLTRILVEFNSFTYPPKNTIDYADGGTRHGTTSA